MGLRIHVETGNGIWSLISITDGVKVHLTLQGIPWVSFNDSESNKNYKNQQKPNKLSKTQLIIWNFLIKREASFVTAQALAIELNTPEKTTKQISDIMYKFKKRLCESPYELLRSFHGEYCLMPVQRENKLIKKHKLSA